MKPYYKTDDGAVTIYCAKWENVLAAGMVKPNDIALVHADPPYGIAHVTDGGAKRNKTSPSIKAYSGGEYGKSWSRIAGDEAPFDPSGLLAIDRPMVLWGANHYSGKLPSSSAWLVWEKKRGGTIAASMTVSDAELAWTSLDGIMVRCFYHMWIGFNRATEVGSHLHPTQKPEALCSWVFQLAKLKRGDLVLVPYMGSGPDLRPAMAAGYRVIACDVAEEYCRTAVSARLSAMPRTEPAATLGPLFAARSRP